MNHEKLDRQLENRHIQLIALGGAIGVGLFLGSAEGIQKAGPSLILTYLFAGLIVFFVMRALGELVLYRPVSGSFSSYANEWLGERASFYTGWTYWYFWIVTGMVEITAVGKYLHHWYPNFPQWIGAFLALFLIYGLNMIAVRWFGEIEFWFALIKILAILLLIVFGLILITVGWGNVTQATGISNLWAHGGLFPNGLSATFFILPLTLFSFIGVELVGIAAGEAKDPQKSLPKAINNVFWRILIFYVGVLVVLMSIYPWSSLDGKTSPFVIVFYNMGIPAAAGIINFVVMTAALSACNSGFFSTGRVMLNLSDQRYAPRFFAQTNKRKLPARALTLSCLLISIGVIINYLVPEKAFSYITSLSTVAGLFTWIIIMLAHLRYRQAVDKGDLPKQSFQMPGGAWVNWSIIAFLTLVILLHGFDVDRRIALLVSPIWFLILEISFRFLRNRIDKERTDDKSIAS